MIWKHFSSFKNNKNTFLKHFSCLRNEKHIFEAFFIFTKWKTYFRSSLHVYKMKNRLLKRFSSLQNENMFSILKLSLFQKKRTLQKHVRSCIGILFCKCKKQFKNVFFLFCEFKNSLQNVLFYFCQNERRFKTFMILFAKTKNASKMCVSFLNMKYDSKAWSMKFLLK